MKWDYAAKHVDRTCRLSINNYIANLLLKFGHKKPLKPQHAPKHHEIAYGAKIQLAHGEPPNPPLNVEGVKHVQAIVGAGLFYGLAVDNKLLVALNTIGTQQATATDTTNKAVTQLLDYMTTYPDDGIVYQSSDMVLAAHADAGSHNESKGRSRAGAHIFLAETNHSLVGMERY